MSVLNISKSKAVANIGSAGAFYERITNKRDYFLAMAKRCAALTLPYLCSQMEGDNTSSKNQTAETLPRPRNGIGASGVKNLASKLVITLFPSHVPFFRFLVNEAVLDEADQIESDAGGGEEKDENGNVVAVGGSLRSEIQKRLLAMEKIITNRTDRKSHRKIIYEAMKQLIVTGNVLLRWLDDGTLKIHKLGEYVVERDYGGNVYRIILKELKLLSLLDDDIRKKILAADPSLKEADDPDVALYTYWGAMDDSTLWETWQEVTDGNIVLPDSYGTYKLDDLPVSAQRWVSESGVDYGRSLCEEHIADLEDLEQLSIDIMEISKACAKIIPLVDPNGMTDVADLAAADNLEFVSGKEEDITVLQLLQHVNDYQAANSMRQEIKSRLEQVFLMYTAAQRDAERVTAEEVRYIANELEKAHGGVYTVLGDELQKPYVEHEVAQALKEGDLDRDFFKDGTIRPSVVTGTEAIGRGMDYNNLLELASMIREFPELAEEFNKSELATRLAVAKGIELDGLLYSPQQKLERQQAVKAAQRTENVEGAQTTAALNEHSAQLQPQ